MSLWNSRMTEFEKRTFMNKLIERIEVFEEKRDDGFILKNIEFKFPLNYTEDGNTWLHNEKTVETVCLLGNRFSEADDYAHVEVTYEDYKRFKE